MDYVVWDIAFKFSSTQVVNSIVICLTLKISELEMLITLRKDTRKKTQYLNADDTIYWNLHLQMKFIKQKANFI